MTDTPESTALVAPAGPAPAPPERVGRHVTSLDGLRALAVGSVMLYHAGAPYTSMGFLGVDLFFVVSGFLITSLLLDEYAAKGRVDLARFWARRFLRLMPAYWLYAGFLTTAMLVVHWGWVQTYEGVSPRLYVASIWLYFVNYLPMGGTWEYQPLASILWSLALEEQFYFAWPVLCSLMLPTGRLSRFAWGAVGAVLAYRAVAGDMEVGYRLNTRGLGILLGCAFALSLRGEAAAGARRTLGTAGARLGIVATAAAVVSAFTALQCLGRVDEPFLLRWALPVVCPLFAALVASLWFGPRGALPRALAWGPLAYVGKISYGMYLYHMAAHYLTWRVLLPGIDGWPRAPKFGLRLLVFFTLTTLAAAVSHELIEKRFLSLKERFR